MVLNSKRTQHWEELFGLVIIESMSQGLIPIASSHTGPSEIITPETGYLFEEGKLEEIIKEISTTPAFDENKSQKARENSEAYLPQEIAKKWKKILA